MAVREKGQDEIVGDVMLQPAPFVDGIEVGWHFRTHVWNRGYATEAARALVDRALRDAICEQVYAAVATRNAPSLRVAEKLGMRPLKLFALAEMEHRLFVIPEIPRSRARLRYSPRAGDFLRSSLGGVA